MSTNIFSSSPSINGKIRGAILGSAIGDALGRIPEVYWIHGGNLSSSYAKKLRNKWQKDFPQGISSFNDFRDSDFENKIAIYTDDTQMSLLVFNGLFNYCTELTKKKTSILIKDNVIVDDMMKYIAIEFSDWVLDPNGGLSYKRAPGIGSTKASRRLRDILASIDSGESVSHNWWAQGEGGPLKPYKEGGCGSVMRAYPFGIIFANDINFACELAAKHSLLTHRAPLAQAACAAMAAGIVRALESATPENILLEMVIAAKKYDTKTATMIQESIDYAKTNPSQEKIIAYLEKLEGRLGHQAIAATALVFACEHNDLLKAIQVAINFYGDSDSVGAMVGALAGAYIGDEALNNKNNYDAWLKPLEDLHLLSHELPQKVIELLKQDNPKSE